MDGRRPYSGAANRRARQPLRRDTGDDGLTRARAEKPPPIYRRQTDSTHPPPPIITPLIIYYLFIYSVVFSGEVLLLYKCVCYQTMDVPAKNARENVFLPNLSH